MRRRCRQAQRWLITAIMLSFVGLPSGFAAEPSNPPVTITVDANSDWQWFPDAGNGVLVNGHDVTGNDPNDANVPADSTFQLGWMQHLKNRWGSAAAGGLRYYLLDNEPSIWFSTHRDVHPTGSTMDQMRDTIVDYATSIGESCTAGATCPT